MSISDTESLISEYAGDIAKEAPQQVQRAGSEEDVRHWFNSQIDNFIDEVDLEFQGKHEYGLAGGRMDSKYSGVVIEYKNPGGSKKITGSRNSPGCREAIDQIQTRFEDLHEKEGVPPERTFGVGTDARHVVFVEYHDGQYDIRGPESLTSVMVERLLRALVSTGAQGKAFTPENLAEDFGEGSDTAQKGVQALHSSISSTDDDRVEVLFNQWKTLFSEVCGYDAITQSEKVEEIAEIYEVTDDSSPAELLFAVHSYYALFTKLLAAEVASRFGPLGSSPIKGCVNAPTSDALQREMNELEEGGIWAKSGIGNFLEGDVFSWYLEDWQQDVEETVRKTAQSLDAYDPATLSADPGESRDLLKDLYQELLPREVRHDLGEYYTPDWLASRVLDGVNYDGDPDTRLLDPACGTGTFLVLAINRLRQWYRDNRHQVSYGEGELINKILSNIVGFDLNPLAVLAARTNYLLAVRDLLKYTGEIELPIYMSDSVLVPTKYSGDIFNPPGSVRKLRTAAGDFMIPNEVTSPRSRVADYADVVERAVKDEYSEDDFISRLESEGLPTDTEKAHRELFKKLSDLHDQRKDGLWARIIKNSFAPLFTDSFDIVAGNPPWVNWESFPGEYRSDTEEIWKKYRLFPEETMDKRQASRKSKTDISILMTYVALDRYLEDDGRLGFVITQSIWQSQSAGRHFRRFELPDGEHFSVEEVHDYLDVKPFKGSSSPTSVMILQKDKKTTYPVSYPKWQRTHRKRIPLDATPAEADDATEKLDWKALPIRKTDQQSSWLIGREKSIKTVRNLVGESAYSNKVREGANTRGRNGIFYVETQPSRVRDEVIVTNDKSAGRKDVPVHTDNVEADHLYPILRGKDVTRWVAKPDKNLAIMMPHNRQHTAEPIPESQLRTNSPKLYSFLKKFENSLRNRRKFRNFDPSNGPFYGLYNVGSYSFSEYKVVWREIASDFIAAPVKRFDHPDLGKNRVMCNHKLMQVPVSSWDEALYLSGMLNSTISRYTVLAYTVSTQMSTHILNNVQVPRYKSSDKNHQKIVSLSRQCRKASINSNNQKLSSTEDKLDRKAANVWGLPSGKVQNLQDALSELV